MPVIHTHLNDSNFRNSARDKLTLSLKGDHFNLLSLKGLGQLVKDYNLKPEEIDLQQNALDSLFELNYLTTTSIRRIYASSNRIEYLCSNQDKPKLNTWSSRMSNLVFLDLSFNRMTDFPDLASMPNLKTLHLQQNALTKDTFRMLEKGKYLEVLDLRGNNLNWASEYQFANDAIVFKTLSKLKTLSMADNRVVDTVPNYYVIVLARYRSRRVIGSRSLDRIDSYIVKKDLKLIADDYAKKTFGKEMELEPPELSSIELVETITTPISKTDLPSLSELNDVLENCFLHPSYAVQNIGKMSNDVYAMVDTRGTSGLFPAGQDSREVELSTEELLQNIVLLSERQPQLLQQLLRITAYLATIQEGCIGDKSLAQLEDFVSAGENHALAMLEVFGDSLIPLLDKTNQNGLRLRIYIVITKIADLFTANSTTMNSINGMSKHLAEVLHERHPIAKCSLAMEVVNLCASIAVFPTMARELGDMDVAVPIARQLENTSTDSDRYRSLLKVVRCLAEFDILKQDGVVIHRSADIFAAENTQRDVFSTLKTIGEGRIIKNDLNHDMLKTDLIACVAALSCSRNIYFGLIHPRVGYLSLLGKFYSSKDSGPLILTAVLKGFAAVLGASPNWFPLAYEGSTLDYNDVFFEVARMLKNFVPLLDMLNPNSDAFSSMCALLPEKEILEYVPSAVSSLKDLTSPIMHSFFIAILELIGIVCHLALDPLVPAAINATEEMNNASREERLFTCLDTPSDGVRKASIDCLRKIPLYEFDNDEVAWLVDLVKNVTNISSGNQEEVVAGALQLMTDICESKEAVGESFREKFAQVAISSCLSILVRNERRDTNGQAEETREKWLLSQACVQFLLASSRYPELHEVLQSGTNLDLMVQVLQLEDKNSDYFVFTPTSEEQHERAEYEPTFVEQTPAGKQTDYLLRTLVGIHSVKPNGVVAARVLRRIGDVLCGFENFETKYSSMSRSSNYTNVKFDSGKSFKELMALDIAAEFQMGFMWNHPMGHTLGVSAKTFVWSVSSKDRINATMVQHLQFAKFSGIERLLAFLAGSIISDDSSVQPSSAVLHSYHTIDIGAVLEQAMSDPFSVEEDPLLDSGKHVLVRKYMEEGQFDFAGANAYKKFESANLTSSDSVFDHQFIGKGGLHDEKQNSQLLVAATRIFYAMLCFGNEESIQSAKSVLGSTSKLKTLAALCMGPPGKPEWGVCLLGAKFMAICYELCLISGIKRETTPAILARYSITCAAARRIIVTLGISMKANQSMSFEDKLTLVHATRTLALVSSQMKSLRLSERGRPNIALEPAARAAVMEKLWGQLIPYSSVVSDVILFLEHSNFGGNNTSADELDAFIVIHINQIIIDILGAVPKSRYEILRKMSTHLNTSLHYSPNHIRASAIQEVLNRVACARVGYDLDRLLWSNEDAAIQSKPSVATPKTNMSIFAICTGSRPTTKASTRVNGKVTWQFEPSMPLPREALESDTTSGVWERDRVGNERILTSCFVDIHSAEGPKRVLLMLTSEAYYCFTKPNWQSNWSENDKPFSNPLLLSFPGVISKSKVPVLLWRRPYRAINRIVLGRFGQELHISHRASDFHGGEVELFSVSTYVSGVADTLYMTFLDMHRRWRDVELLQPNLNQVLEPLNSRKTSC